ncbi:MAG: response regulator [Pseudomonadota bacterium]
MLVLLAENDPACRLVARSILERDGFRVRFACDGDRAVALARLVRFDVIVLDVAMPALNGLQAAQRIRHDLHLFGNPHTRLIALTAYDTPQDIARCRASGIDGIIAKPLRSGDLEAALSTWTMGGAAASIGVAANMADAMSRPLLDEGVVRGGPGLSDPATREQIWQTYRASLSTSLKDIAASLRGHLAGDSASAALFMSALHSLRSASLTVGMNRAPYMARELRHAPRDAIVPQTVRLLHTVRDSLPRLEAVLQDISVAPR